MIVRYPPLFPLPRPANRTLHLDHEALAERCQRLLQFWEADAALPRIEQLPHLLLVAVQPADQLGGLRRQRLDRHPVLPRLRLACRHRDVLAGIDRARHHLRQSVGIVTPWLDHGVHAAGVGMGGKAGGMDPVPSHGMTSVAVSI